jgi:hypothetical protein
VHEPDRATEKEGGVMKLFIADKENRVDINAHYFEEIQKMVEFAKYWAFGNKNSVYVCFDKFSDVPPENTFLFITACPNSLCEILELYGNTPSLFAFEFHTYQEALIFCQDLMEGF